MGELSFLLVLGPDSKRDSQEPKCVFCFSGSRVLLSVPSEEMHLRLVDRERPAVAPGFPSGPRGDFTLVLRERFPSSLPALPLLSEEAPVVWKMGSMGPSPRCRVEPWPLWALFLRSSSTNSERAADGLGSLSLGGGDTVVPWGGGDEDGEPGRSGVPFLWTAKPSPSPKWQGFCGCRDAEPALEVSLGAARAPLNAEDAVLSLPESPASPLTLCQEEKTKLLGISIHRI